MRNVRFAIAGAVAAATALSMVGFSTAAQAQPHSSAATAIKPVPAGPATAISMTKCPSGTKASLGSSTPALPNGATGAVFPLANKNSLKLVGAWPPSPTSYAVTVKCSNGSTLNVKVNVQSAPVLNSAVGVGSDTITPLLDQFSGDYNATLTSGTATHLFSWDAVNPDNGQTSASIPPSMITPKQGCNSINRPNGSGAGIGALATTQVVSGTNCVSFARSSRPRGGSDPAFKPGGVAFVNLAGDAVTWSTQSVTNAPASLTVAQLNAIYTCSSTATNWSQLGGKSGTIQPFLPQSGSGTLSVWLTAIGVTTPGPCVSQPATLEENEGVNALLQSPNAIFPYSIGDWIAQHFHSATCSNASCSAFPPCAPSTAKNQFSCNLTGTMVVKQIAGVPPTTGTGTSTVINSAFPSAFDRTLFDVVPFDPNTADHIPGSEAGAPGGVNLEPIFGASGWVCTSAQAKTDIKNYGFVPIGTCGATS
jgi:hypothetical protein